MKCPAFTPCRGGCKWEIPAFDKARVPVVPVCWISGRDCLALPAPVKVDRRTAI
jgi:hypothetical protein